ncbi:hypothetical protein E6P09_07705 [Haloferax mediterranei ATCC 33500]|uniref:Uncharacterized protein n=1 Tax=Haloferax mediterranei (strain ATCC 33500 / DSM 1411 / JCM 8866 / NBRC 14739 / NCIMB 2177 / R-4) TaxID=523841 RepID=I3R341_HALMT|nr:HTH domain-containing protein [Haloferax mediterranei]AFK18651.1 hypothetical protein HFX_0932 [Haloferax mediterranei ATCC 33500]AHZ21979.1 hypothetical protein BM92_04565 [Haloferax mediterranei ATCC 33500]EMA03491.1 hypothetical protein C439_05815 [Haloferax mediterranei ATCC 33500]MDX5988745.1 HTH domain-containing protein [Haloferax mediterranei ATCC 33500]QCQ75152.1 hypothetical protein E6P09_07705 [Haloferax mediterranei ATCC 33500]
MQTNETRKAELWIRPIRDGLGEEHQSLVVRLERLINEGLLDDMCIRTWDHDVDVESDVAPTKRDALIRERLAECEQWAQTEDVDLPSIEEHATVGSGRMGPSHDTVVLPQTLVVLFRGEEIEAVYPYERDGQKKTVADWVEDAESFLGIDNEQVEV